MLIYFILLYLTLNTITQARSDYTHDVTSTTGSLAGVWKNKVFCPDNTYIYSYNQLQECTSLGTNYIKVLCNQYDHSSTDSEINSNPSPTIDAGTWQNQKSCEPYDFFFSYYVSKTGKSYPNGYFPDELGMNDVRIKCTNGADYLNPGGGCATDWSTSASCNKGEVFCGYQLKYDDFSFIIDNVAGDDLIFMCCLICKKHEGFYLAAIGSIPSCMFCYAYCKTCSDAGQDKCSSCYSGDLKIGSQCAWNIGYDEVINAFGADTFSDSDSNISKFSSDLSTIRTTTCYGKSWVGGYGVFGKNNRLSYVLEKQAPYFKLRIKAKFLKIDEWASNSFKIFVDGTAKDIKEISNIDEKYGKLFFGNTCGGAGPEDIINVDYTMDYNTNAGVDITFTSDLVKSASETSWGVRDIIIGIYKCHISCMTCTGYKNSDCTECYPQASKVNGLCTCNDNYFEVSSSSCSAFPCTVCQQCDPGCKKCSSNANNACSSCMTGYFLSTNMCVTQCISPEWGDTTSGTCVSSCQSTQFTNLALRTCINCDVSCATCETTATNCLICASNTFKNVLTNLCVSDCPDGYYGDSSTKQCELCDFDCSTCSGGKKICTSCASTYTKNGDSCLPPTFYSKIDTQLSTPDSFSSHTFTVFPPLSSKSLCIYDCGAYKILGGINCLAQNSYLFQSYSNLRPHYVIQITFYWVKIDYWNRNKIFVNIDDTERYSTPISSDSDPGNFLCGQADNPDARRALNFLTPHSSTSIKIKIYTNLNGVSNVASWGISDFSFILLVCHDTCLTCSGKLVNNCKTCGPNAILTNSQCTCPIGFFTVLSNPCTTSPCSICTSCDKSCESCDGVGSSNCLTCISSLFLLNKQCLSTCPEPYVGQLLTNKCETVCLDLNEIIDDTRICRACHSDCLKCSGLLNTDCISCKNPLFHVLNKESQNLCLENCGNGYYQSSNNCIQCSENCNKCDNNGCLECIGQQNLENGKCFTSCQKDINLNQLYFNNITQTCEKTCPSSTYPNINTKTCWPCDSKCTKCFGLSINECSSCVEKYFIQKSSCVDSCFTGYFFNEQGKTCEKCILNCNKCLNTNSCLECENGFSIMRPNNDSCTACDKLNNYKNAGYCFECSADCNLCESADRCQICLAGYYLSAGKCLAQKIIKAQLTYDSINPFRIHLKFNSYWKNGFDMLFSKIQIKIKDLNLDLYSYVLKKNENDNTDFFIDFSFKSNVTLGMKLNVKLEQLPTQDEYNLTITEYELSLKEFYQCPDGNAYNVTTKSCYQTILVTPILEYSNNLDELIFRFDPDFDSLFQVFPNNTLVSILGINFTYNFIVNAEKSYIIKFIFNNTFTNKPVCKLLITIPPQILYNSSNLFNLESNTVSIVMRNYYLMDNSVKNTIENARKTTEQMNSISSTATMGNSFLSFGSSMAISIMMSMEIIRFLKYLNIDYPPNVEGMFKSSLRGEGIIPDILIDVDNDEKATLPYTFTKYKNSIYSFNNNGNILIENIFYLGLGVLILFIHKILESKITSSTIASKIFDFLLYMLVWNFSITYFLGVYLNYIFFSLLSFKFPPSTTLAGTLNIVYSSVLFTIIFMMILFFWWKIRFFHLSKKEGDNYIFPDQDTIPISKSEIFSSKNDNSHTNNTNSPPNQVNFKVTNLEGSPNEKRGLNISENDQPKKENINKNFLIEDIVLAPKKEINKKESRFSRFLRRKSTTIHKLVDTIGVPTRAMNKIINNFFSRSSKNNITPFKDSSSTYVPSLPRKKTRFDCLNNGLNHSNKGQSFYILFDVMRQTLIAFMIVFLFDNPIAATGIINFINFNFFVLIVFIQPQKAKLDIIQTIFNELCVNLACFAAMALAIMERTGNDEDPNIKLNVGWIIVAANITFMVVFLGRFFLTLFLSLFNYFVKIYKKYVENRKNSKTKGGLSKNSISPLSNENLVVSSVEEQIEGKFRESEEKK